MMKPVDLQNGYKPMKRRLHSKNMAGPGKALDIHPRPSGRGFFFRMPRQRHVGAAHKTEKIVR